MTTTASEPLSAASGSTTGLTPSSTPLTSSTKRLSTIKTPGSPKTSKSAGGVGTGGAAGVKDVVSPGELCGFVDTLLSQLETRFDEMSEQVLSRMNDMSTRIDNLETTIQDLMTGDLDGPAPAPTGSRQPSTSSINTPASAPNK